MTELVFWHGWAMSPDVWLPLIRALYKAYARPFSIQTPALPGYSGKPIPEKQTGTAWVDAMMEEVLEPVTLCAWSMGAIMALDAARRYPGKVEKLILFGATPCFINRKTWEYGLPGETVQRFMDGIKVDSRAALWRFIMLFNQHDLHMRDILLQL